MHRFRVIGIVGLPGSGKTEVAKVANRLGIPQVRMGDTVLEELKRQGRRVTEQSVGMVAAELRQREGPAAIAKRCLPSIRGAGEGKRAVVVDGIRGAAEVEEFRRTFGDRFFLIAVRAEDSIRYSRVSSRRRTDDIKTLEKFREKDRRELGWGLSEALSMADFTVVNEGTLGELRERAKEIFAKILVSSK